MNSLLFSSVEAFFSPVLSVIVFFVFFLRSFSLMSANFTNVPAFKRRRLKYVDQSIETLTNSANIAGITLLALMFQNQQPDVFNSVPQSTLVLLYLFLFIFLRFLEKNLQTSGNARKLNRGINSSNLFLVLFVPTAWLVLQAKNLVDFLLPIEVASYLFYFIFLEASYLQHVRHKTKKNWTASLMRGFMYYFWLSFFGTVFFICALYSATSTVACLELSDIQFSSTENCSNLNVSTAIAGFLVCGLTFKIGGLFFFFFKTDLYKLLPAEGVVIFSIFTSFYYLLIVFFLIVKLPFVLYFFKYFLLAALSTATIAFVVLSGLQISNFFLFCGLSSVLTMFFCLIVAF